MTKSDDPVGIGIVGTGGMGRFHARCFGFVNDVQIVGCCDIDAAAAQRFADEEGTAVYPDVETLIAEARPDVLDICTPPDSHREHAQQAASAGVHVFCEKPIAHSVGDAEAMVEACRRAGVHLCIGHVVRFFPEYARARQAVLDGAVGRPALVRLSRQARWPRRSWYGDFACSGKVVGDVMIHDLDWLRWVFGEVERVYAQGLAFRDLEMDYALATLRLTSGVIAHLDAAWNPVGGFRTGGEIVGDGGLLTFDNAASPLAVEYAESPESGLPLSTLPLSWQPYLDQLSHFVDVVRGQTELIVPPEDAVAALRLSMAVLDSIKTGQPVILKKL